MERYWLIITALSQLEWQCREIVKPGKTTESSGAVEIFVNKIVNVVGK